jgi:hypothetical protein
MRYAQHNIPRMGIRDNFFRNENTVTREATSVNAIKETSRSCMGFVKDEESRSQKP